MGKGEKPLFVVGESVELIIDGLTAGGEGVARHRGFTIFVPRALPGDRVRAEIISLKPSYGRALLKELLSPAGDRVGPPCPFYEACGGCQLQQLSYESQLNHKRQWVIDALQRIGKLENVRVHETLPMADPWHYRNKAQFPVGQVAGNIVAGPYRRRSHEIVPIDDCLIQHPISSRLIDSIQKFAVSRGLTAYDESTGKGLLRHILIRFGFRTGEALAVLVTAAEPFPEAGEFAEILLKEFPELVGVVRNINPRRTNVILGEKTLTLAGRDYLIDELGGLKFRISARSFYQVNPVQTEKLYEIALNYADLKGLETVIDAYSGLGTIALFLARRAKKVIGIEVNKDAIADARQNAVLNQIENVEFITGRAEMIMPRLYREGLRPDVIIVDPPRAGCAEPFLKAIAEMEPSRVIYVSCNPATLARDLAYLDRRGFRVREVQPVDMFPHTGHVETVALIYRIKL